MEIKVEPDLRLERGAAEGGGGTSLRREESDCKVYNSMYN